VANAGSNTVEVLLNATPFLAVPARTGSEVALGAIVPNPSRGFARIPFSLPHDAHVRLGVIDAQGRRVAVLADGFMPAGRHEVTWNGDGDRGRVAPGIYFVACETGGKTLVRRLAITR